jgi:hypothetical protein
VEAVSEQLAQRALLGGEMKALVDSAGQYGPSEKYDEQLEKEEHDQEGQKCVRDPYPEHSPLTHKEYQEEHRKSDD